MRAAVSAATLAGAGGLACKRRGVRRSHAPAFRDPAMAHQWHIPCHPWEAAAGAGPPWASPFDPSAFVAVRRICLRDAEVAGSNPAFPTRRVAGHGALPLRVLAEMSVSDHRQTTDVAAKCRDRRPVTVHHGRRSHAGKPRRRGGVVSRRAACRGSQAANTAVRTNGPVSRRSGQIRGQVVVRVCMYAYTHQGWRRHHEGEGFLRRLRPGPGGLG